jgi:hypothetical protein
MITKITGQEHLLYTSLVQVRSCPLTTIAGTQKMNRAGASCQVSVSNVTAECNRCGQLLSSRLQRFRPLCEPSIQRNCKSKLPPFPRFNQRNSHARASLHSAASPTHRKSEDSMLMQEPPWFRVIRAFCRNGKIDEVRTKSLLKDSFQFQPQFVASTCYVVSIPLGLAESAVTRTK